MANEVKYNGDGLILVDTTTKGVATVLKEPWYTVVAETERYYKLDDVNDSSGNERVFVNVNTVDFGGGFAAFNGIDNYLRETGYTVAYDASMTIFFWARWDGDFDVLPGNTLFCIDGEHDIIFRGFNQGAAQSSRYNDGGSQFDGLLNAGDGVWCAYCIVRDGGTATLYSGTTDAAVLSTDSALASNIGTAFLDLGSFQATVRFFDGDMGGLIMEYGNSWSQGKVSTQIAKGPYHLY